MATYLKQTDWMMEGNSTKLEPSLNLSVFISRRDVSLQGLQAFVAKQYKNWDWTLEKSENMGFI